MTRHLRWFVAGGMVSTAVFVSALYFAVLPPAMAVTSNSGAWMALQRGKVRVGRAILVPPEFAPGFFPTDSARRTWWEYGGPSGTKVVEVSLTHVAGVALVIAVSLFGLSVIAWVRRRLTPGRCDGCGYDCSGIDMGAPCPECGRRGLRLRE